MIRSDKRIAVATKPGSRKQRLVGVVDPRATSTSAVMASSGQGTVTAGGDKTIGFFHSRGHSPVEEAAIPAAVVTRKPGAAKVPAQAKKAEKTGSGPYGNVDLSFTGGPSALGLPANTPMSNVQVPAMLLPLLDGFASEHPLMMNRIHREIYERDPISGSVVRLLSTFPFGDFTLSGLKNESQLRTYSASLDSIRIHEMLPSITTDHCVIGAFLGISRWSDEKKYWSAILPQNIDLVEITPTPVFGDMPIMKLKVPKEITDILNSDEPEFQRIKEQIPDEFRDVADESIPLEPEDVLWLPNPGMSTDYRGVSMFRSVVPIWLTEKALIRGTLDQFWKRQRPILHVMIGDDEWKPTQQDYRAIAELILLADQDPTGAVMITRHGIDINEIRRGDDFVKHTDYYQTFEQMKFRALGVSEAVMGSDFSITAAEGAINITLQRFGQFRTTLTQKIFYDKLFAGIAVANGFMKHRSHISLSSGSPLEQEAYLRDEFGGRAYSRTNSRNETSWAMEFSAASGPSVSHVPEMLRGVRRADMHRYAIPTVEWHTPMVASDVNQRLDILEKLASFGWPIPLRMMAAAANVNIESLIEQKNSDIKLRRFLRPWRKEVAKDQQTAEAGFNPESGGESEESSSAMFGSVRRRPLLQQFGEEQGRLFSTVGGKPRQLTRAEQRRVDEKANRRIAEAAVAVHGYRNKAENERYRANAARKFYPMPAVSEDTSPVSKRVAKKGR